MTSDDKDLKLLEWLEAALLEVVRNTSVANVTTLTSYIKMVRDALVRAIRNSAKEPFVQHLDPLIKVILVEVKRSEKQ